MSRVAVDRGGKIEAWAVDHGMYPSNLTTAQFVPRARMLNFPTQTMDELSPIGVQKSTDGLNLALYGLSNPTPTSVADLIRKLFHKKSAVRLELFFLNYLPTILPGYNHIVTRTGLQWPEELSNWEPLVSDIPLSMKEGFPVTAIGDRWLKDIRQNLSIASPVEDYLILLNYFTNSSILSAIQAMYQSDTRFAKTIEQFNSALPVTQESLGLILQSDISTWTEENSLVFIRQWIYNNITMGKAPAWYSIPDYYSVFGGINKEIVNGFSIVALAYTRLLINKNSWLIGKHAEIYTAFYGVFAAIYRQLCIPDLAGYETKEEMDAFNKNIRTLRIHMIVAATRPLSYTLKKGGPIPYETDVDEFLQTLQNLKNYGTTSAIKINDVRKDNTQSPRTVFNHVHAAIYNEIEIFDNIYLPVLQRFANIYEQTEYVFESL